MTCFSMTGVALQAVVCGLLVLMEYFNKQLLTPVLLCCVPLCSLQPLPGSTDPHNSSVKIIDHHHHPQ